MSKNFLIILGLILIAGAWPVNILIRHEDKFRPPSPLIDTLIQKMVREVSSDTLHSFLKILTGDFGIRYSTWPGCSLAVNWVMNKFRAYGLDSVYLQHYQTRYAKNSIGIKRGTRFPNWQRYYVICAHIDSDSNSPGVNDNGSGTACVLEAARVMSRYRFENGIRFITFTGNLQGLLGSDAYVRNARSQGDSILGALNFDMLLFEYCDPETLAVYRGRSLADSLLCSMFKAAVDTYTTLPTKIKSQQIYNSDQASFWSMGYPALLGIENNYAYDQYAGTPGDTLGAPRYSLSFLTKCVQGAIAGLARPAVPMPVTKVKELSVTNSRIPELLVYPNPTKTDVRFQMIVVSGKDLSLKIYDVTGQLVKDFRLSSTISRPAHLVIHWNLRDDSCRRLPAGVYIVRLKTGDRLALAKIVLLE